MKMVRKLMLVFGLAGLLKGAVITISEITVIKNRAEWPV